MGGRNSRKYLKDHIYPIARGGNASKEMLFLEKIRSIWLKVYRPAYDMDWTTSVPAVKANITPMAIILIGFLENWIAARINETVNKAAINDAGAIIMGSSLVKATNDSILISTSCNLKIYNILKWNLRFAAIFFGDKHIFGSPFVKIMNWNTLTGNSQNPRPAENDF